jgi:hypothetical protein
MTLDCDETVRIRAVTVAARLERVIVCIEVANVCSCFGYPNRDAGILGPTILLLS